MNEEYNKKINKTITTHLLGVPGWITTITCVLHFFKMSANSRFFCAVLPPLIMLLFISFRFIYSRDPFGLIGYSITGIILGIIVFTYYFTVFLLQ